MPTTNRETGATSHGLSGSMRTAAWPSGSEYRRASGVGADVVHVEDRPDGLVLEPLARVARMDPGPLGQLGRGGRPAVRQGAVQPEPVAEVHGLQVEGAERGAHQAAGELVAARLGVRGGVGGDGHGWHLQSSTAASDGATAAQDARRRRRHGHQSISKAAG